MKQQGKGITCLMLGTKRRVDISSDRMYVSMYVCISKAAYVVLVIVMIPVVTMMMVFLFYSILLVLLC